MDSLKSEVQRHVLTSDLLPVQRMREHISGRQGKLRGTACNMTRQIARACRQRNTMNKGRCWKAFALSAALLCCAVVVSGGGEATDKLSAKDARRLIARVAGVELKTDAVRVKDISILGTSAVVVAEVETAFRFGRGQDGRWRVAEIRTGDNRWEDVDLLVKAVNVEKRERARAELEMMGGALEAFRRERGFYVVADDSAVLIDQLSPRYIRRVVRSDPWHNPYGYEGAVDRFYLRSAGPDRIAGTTDDVAVSNQNR